MEARTPTADRTTSVTDSQSRVPLCVDLDGTLLRTDLLWEATLSLVKTKPLALCSIPFWLFGGRAYLKRRIAEANRLDVAALPYRAEVLDLINTAREQGRRTVLVSAAEQQELKRVAAHLGCFDEVIGSDGVINLKGAAKRAVLEQRFGHKGFDYAGDHLADVEVWKAARAAYVISHSNRLNKRAQAAAMVEPITLAAPRSLWMWLAALRIHQWSKNILVAVPLVMAHRLEDSQALLGTVIAFVAFCFVSSSTYLANDLVDLEADRSHATKRHRPFAAGSLVLWHGVFVAVLLLILGFALGAAAGAPFLLLLATYYVTSVCYSAFWKRIAIFDVVILAGFYTLRIFAGGAAANTAVSVWLLAFSMFFFFSLAIVKRFSELRAKADVSANVVTGRGYMPSDLPILGALGVGSGLLSVLVLVLYVMSAEVTVLYGRPQLLLLICPLLLYWIARVWLLTARGLMHEDPVVFAISDRTSYGLGLLAAAVVYLGTL